MFLATPPLLFAYDVVICEALKFASESVKLPVEAPVKEPVPTVTLSALSSQPIKTLSELPLSRTRPMSLPGVPVVPFPNSINLSSMTVFVDDAVVVGENIALFRERGMEPKEAAVKAATQVSTPVFFAVSTICLVEASISL